VPRGHIYKDVICLPSSSRHLVVRMQKFVVLVQLQIASAEGNAIAMRLLILHGADADATYDNNRQPLDLAREAYHEDVVEQMIEGGAYIDLSSLIAVIHLG